MILEVVRMVVDALEHTTEGVNAQLALIPRDTGDPLPEAVRKVLDRTRSSEFARGDVPADFPLLLVALGGPGQASGEVSPVPGIRDAESVPVSIAYVVRAADTARAVQDTDYTIRAVVRALRAWLDDSRFADQVRNQVQVRGCSALTYDEAAENLDHGTITGIVTATITVRDIFA